MGAGFLARRDRVGKIEMNAYSTLDRISIWEY